MNVLTLDFPKVSTTRDATRFYRVACKHCGRTTLCVSKSPPKIPISCSACNLQANRDRTTAQRARKWTA